MTLQGYHTEPFGHSRRMVAATSTVGRQNNVIHGITEVDVTLARQRLRAHKQRTGEALSFTGWEVACVGRTLAEHPRINAMRSGRHLVLLEDAIVGTSVEREVDGELVPEPCPIQGAHTATVQEITARLREAQAKTGAHGELSGGSWALRLVPSWLFTAFVRWARRSKSMARRYGVVGVTAVGMEGAELLPDQ